MNYLEIKDMIDRSGSGKMVLDFNVSGLNSLGTGGKAAALVTMDSLEGLLHVHNNISKLKYNNIIIGCITLFFFFYDFLFFI